MNTKTKTVTDWVKDISFATVWSSFIITFGYIGVAAFQAPQNGQDSSVFIREVKNFYSSSWSSKALGFVTVVSIATYLTSLAYNFLQENTGSIFDTSKN